MKKQYAAIFTALFVTLCIAMFIFAVGGSAIFNNNGVAALSSPDQTSTNNGVSLTNEQVAQMQDLINQYQDREQQYQQREQKLQEQLQEANLQIQKDQQMLQQVQMLLGALQQQGLIRISSDGRIVINR